VPLMIVESPRKIKTLAQITGDQWDFAATKGHLYDLPEEEMGIGEDYRPEWVPISEGAVKELRGQVSGTGEVYLATDPDREGEAIAWQVEEFILNGTDSHRVRLESITESEVDEQVSNPGDLDLNRVESQWARRLLDRLAGYRISPFLINAFKGKKLSAGRVQSAVLARIVEQWAAYEEFEPETYYNLFATVSPSDSTTNVNFETRLVELDDEPLGTDEDEWLLTDEDRVESIRDTVDSEGLEIIELLTEETKTHPRYPFDSSSLIRVGSDWFGWSAGKTMNLAQSLYESGLITYHRSDSTKISQEGCGKASGFIKEEYGEEYHQWRGGGGGDQEGHEAIRAENPYLKPSELKYVDGQRKLLYSVIWQRYVRSQMTPAVWEKCTAILRPAGGSSSAIFKGSVRRNREPGFYRCARSDEETPVDEALDREDFEAVSGAASLDVTDTRSEESETQGPYPYTEGRLVSMMKEEGIGRPSTYHSTIERLRRRGYVEEDDGWIKPTNRGRDVSRFLERAIPAITSVDLTKEMEEQLDEIARGKRDWSDFVAEFDQDLDEWLDEAEGMEPEGTAERTHEPLGFASCPLCDSTLIRREGQYGEFVHCEDDDCDFSSNPPAKTYRCPECDRHMVKPRGRKSTHYECLDPECEGKRPVGSPNKTLDEFIEQAPDCPECDETMTLRKGRYGKFWGCPEYPDCEGKRTYDG
jgi:DNA topoisomerase-1